MDATSPDPRTTDTAPAVPAGWGVVTPPPTRSPLRVAIIAVLGICLAAVVALPWVIDARSSAPAPTTDPAFEALVAYANDPTRGATVPSSAAALLTAAREVRTPDGPVLVLAGQATCWALDLDDLTAPPHATHEALCE